jgi:hypothetical protein
MRSHSMRRLRTDSVSECIANAHRAIAVGVVRGLETSAAVVETPPVGPTQRVRKSIAVFTMGSELS